MAGAAAARAVCALMPSIVLAISRKAARCAGEKSRLGSRGTTDASTADDSDASSERGDGYAREAELASRREEAREGHRLRFGEDDERAAAAHQHAVLNLLEPVRHGECRGWQRRVERSDVRVVSGAADDNSIANLHQERRLRERPRLIEGAQQFSAEH